MCVFQGVCGDYTHRVSERVSCKKIALYFAVQYNQRIL